MVKTAINGNFGLDEIKNIKQKNYGFGSFYQITFVNDTRKLYVCDYHSFLTDDSTSKNTKELKKGDKIWIDIHAFTLDKSFIEPPKKSKKCTIL